MNLCLNDILILFCYNLYAYHKRTSQDLRTVLLSQDALSGLAIHTLQQLVVSGYLQQLLYIFVLQFVISCRTGYCTWKSTM